MNMNKLKVGFIGFMPFTAKGEEYFGYLKDYAEIGYKGFENGSGLLADGKAEENLARVRSYGIEPIDIGLMSFPGRPEPTIDEVIRQAHQLGVKRVVAFNNLASLYRFGGRPEPASYDEIMGEIENFEKKASALKAEGIDFMYHNHDVELKQCYRGVPQLQFIAANSENITFELDCGWATYAGANPVALIHQLGNRISALHIKDYVEEIVGYRGMPNVKVPQFTTVGTGKLDLYGCLKAGAEEGREWAIVEQDFQNKLTPKETLTAAYLNMKETGFVE
jgi:sugar phosphate isomerase/epimerase